MRMLQFRSFAFALGAVATAGVALLLAAPQFMPPPNPMAARLALPPQPHAQPAAAAAAANAAPGFSPARFGHLPFDMMAQPGMPGRPLYGMGSMGYAPGQGGMSSYQGYGAQAGGYQQDGGAAGARPEAASEEKSLSRILTAAGLPNEEGQLQWPVGLRVVGGAAANDLREQIDALVQEGAGHARSGPANANLAQELTRSTGALRKLLLREREERFSLPLTTYEDAEHFLGKLDRAAKLLAAGLEPPGGKVRLEAREGSAGEVGLYDNRFDPPTLTVPAGTTVRWANRGQHRHTVTSDKGDWGSKELGPEGTYSYTFTQPGTYPYHCEVHPKEMQGSVVVK